MASVLVTGGAGYIGSVTVDLLVERGETVVVLDDLSKGHADAVNDQAAFVRGDIGDRDLVRGLAAEHDVTSVVHFAGLIAVGESVADPLRYIDVNVARSANMLAACVDAGVGQIVFSSSAAVYGTPDGVPIPETHPVRPSSPYGWTKASFETMLGYADAGYGLRSVCLRYFNAAGATPQRWERHEPETHLIPNVLAAAADPTRSVSVFGDDYPTPDGTAIRDYIHVEDLAAAHLVALDHLAGGGPSERLNVGTGRGFSVLEVIESARRVTDRPIEVRMSGRRTGDPPILVADSAAVRSLGWEPQRPALDDMIESAWRRFGG